MLKFVALLALILSELIIFQPANADEWVNGYTRSDGTYVNGYWRSSPNGTPTDNYSYSGNVNPYTGQVGTDHYTHNPASPYYQGPSEDDGGDQ